MAERIRSAKNIVVVCQAEGYLDRFWRNQPNLITCRLGDNPCMFNAGKICNAARLVLQNEINMDRELKPRKKNEPEGL